MANGSAIASKEYIYDVNPVNVGRKERSVNNRPTTVD